MNSARISPFVFGRPLDPTEPRAGVALSQISDHLNDERAWNGGNWMFTAPRRSGLTSTIAAALAGGPFTFVRVSMADVASPRDTFDRLATACETLLKNLVGTSGDKTPLPYTRALETISGLRKRVKEYPAAECLRELLSRALSDAAVWTPIVVWIDDVRDLAEETVAAEALLGAAGQAGQRRVSLLWSGVDDTAAEMLRTQIPGVVSVAVAPPSISTLADFLIARFAEHGIAFPAELAERAITWIPIPDDLCRFGHYLWSRTDGAVTRESFRRAMLDAAAEGDRRLGPTLANNTPLQRRALMAYALLEGSPLAAKLVVEWSGATYASSLQRSMKTVLASADPVLLRTDEGVVYADSFARLSLLRKFITNPGSIPAFTEGELSESTRSALRFLSDGTVGTALAVPL